MSEPYQPLPLLAAHFARHACPTHTLLVRTTVRTTRGPQPAAHAPCRCISCSRTHAAVCTLLVLHQHTHRSPLSMPTCKQAAAFHMQHPDVCDGAYSIHKSCSSVLLHCSPFARNLIDLGISTRVGLVPCGAGGTNLFTSWLPPNQDMYQRMVAQTRAAMAAAGKDARLRGMIMILVGFCLCFRLGLGRMACLFL